MIVSPVHVSGVRYSIALFAAVEVASDTARVGNSVHEFRVDAGAKRVGEEAREDVSLLLELHRRAEEVLVRVVLVEILVGSSATTPTVEVVDAPVLRRFETATCVGCLQPVDFRRRVVLRSTFFVVL